MKRINVKPKKKGIEYYKIRLFHLAKNGLGYLGIIAAEMVGPGQRDYFKIVSLKMGA